MENGISITPNMTLEEINTLPEFDAVKDHLIGGGKAWFTGETGQDTLLDLEAKHLTWNTEDIVYGLKNLQRVALSGKRYVFHFNKDQPMVSLLYVPAVKRTKKTFVLLLGGGAYGAVCTMIESLPVAAWFNAKGFDCFCLNYRTAIPESFVSGLMPKPLEDIASALCFIKERETELGLSISDYCLAGFSAGGHLSALWGTAHLGARHYGLPSPCGLLLAYPLISLSTLSKQGEEFLVKGLFGAEKWKNVMSVYEIIKHIDKDYPKTYAVQCMDDDTVLPKNADMMEKALQSKNVPCLIERYLHGGHGFGLGSKTPGTVWLKHAIGFLLGSENDDDGTD